MANPSAFSSPPPALRSAVPRILTVSAAALACILPALSATASEPGTARPGDARAWVVPADSMPESQRSQANPPIYIAFLWHMHQPLYWPGQTILETQAAGAYSYSVFDIHNQRWGPYTTWPRNAVQMGIDAGLPHAGASVSFSGSLVENLNHLEASGNGNFANWTAPWNQVINQITSLGNQRMDMIGFGYYHPLMGLIETEDIREQIRMHKQILAETFDGAYSKGIFPPENAFSLDMIPALAAEGLEWALVDNIHFERAAAGYPYSTGGNLYEPNRADVRNPDPGDWVQLNGLWAPTRVSAQWSRQPRYVAYTDPETGQTSRIIAVPTDRYLGNEDGRGGFGALQYEAVMSQLEAYNTDSDHPILIVLHHDGDNYGGGSDGYYNANFQAFIDWVKARPDRFAATTIQDYLDMYPPDPNDVIHVESGSWAGADNGDPEFLKWLGDPGTDGYSPDRNSWAVITAAKNVVDHALDVNPGNGETAQARRMLMNAQASDYWYWDGSMDGIWDTHPTTASNMAVASALTAIGGSAGDATPPTIFKPQREPYNPGETEWTLTRTNEFDIWTYVYDHSGLSRVELRYRLLQETEFPDGLTTTFSQIVPGDPRWLSATMAGWDTESRTNVAPTLKAQEFTATLTGITDRFVEYFVEAEDANGNVERSLIQTVWVGSNTSDGGSTGGGGGGGGGTVSSTLAISPDAPTREDVITVEITDAAGPAKLHWGVNNQGSQWTTPDPVYWPAGTVRFNGTGPAVESQFAYDETAGTLTLQIGPFNDPAQAVDRVNFVIRYDSGSWDNNGGADYLVDFGDGGAGSGGADGGGSGGGHTFTMDGVLDGGVDTLARADGASLFASRQGNWLYLATESAAGSGSDRFLLLQGADPAPVPAPWAKAGQTAGRAAFLANEQSNNYAGWFDAGPSAELAVGAVVEGVVELAEAFGGAAPDTVRLALAAYGNPDGGALTLQLPAGNGDGNVDAAEFTPYPVRAEGGSEGGSGDGSGGGSGGGEGSGGLLRGDVDGNGNVQAYDASLLLQYVVGLDPLPALDPRPWEAERMSAADADGDGSVIAFDASVILQYTVGLLEKLPGDAASGAGAAADPNEASSTGSGGSEPLVVSAQWTAGELTVSVVPASQAAPDAPGVWRLPDSARAVTALQLQLPPAGDGFGFGEPVAEAALDSAAGVLAYNPGDTDGLRVAVAAAHPLQGDLLRIPLQSDRPRELHLPVTANTLRGTLVVPAGAAGVSAGREEPIPADFGLEANYPNPFNPLTLIRFRMREAADVRLEVADALGRPVAVLAQGRRAAGVHTATFDGGGLASGVYFARMSVDGRPVDVIRMLLVK